MEKPPGPKPQNINSVHYLLCFRHIQALPKASLFVTVFAPKLVPEPLRKGSPKKLAKRLQFLPENIRKRTPEGSQSGPKIHKNPTSFGPFLGTRNSESQILLAPRDRVTPLFDQKREHLTKKHHQKSHRKNTVKKMVADVKMESRRLPKWSQNGAKTSQKGGPDPVLEGRPKKNLKTSIPYIICYVLSTSRPPKTSLFVTFLGPKLDPEPLRKGSPTELAKMRPFLPENCRKGTPERYQNGAKNRHKFDFCPKMVRKWGVEIPGVLRRPKMDSKIIKT